VTTLLYIVSGVATGTLALMWLASRAVAALERAEATIDEDLEAVIDAAQVRHPAGRGRWTAHDDRMLARECRLERGGES
jgi:hypothetical protein